MKLSSTKKSNEHDILEAIIERYTEPTFGSLTKKETDIMIFRALQDLGLIGNYPDVYDVMSKLKVTRAKARTLIAESSLRRSSDEDLKQELTKLLESESILVADNKICLEIENPMLMDFLRAKLKENKYITDGSFSPEIVKLSVPAYLAICKDYANVHYNNLVALLNDNGISTTSKIYETISGVLVTGISQIGGPLTGKITEIIKDYLPKFINKLKANNENNKKEN
ncbi:MAG: hypothetical protein J5542_08355 [Bacteroidales bacterium]|nr:hypothetical protein [Bacteroidales bacterium]